MPPSRNAVIRISNAQGRLVETFQKPIELGINELLYDHGYGQVGTYYYALYVADQLVDTKKMVFVAN